MAKTRVSDLVPKCKLTENINPKTKKSDIF